MIYVQFQKNDLTFQKEITERRGPKVFLTDLHWTVLCLATFIMGFSVLSIPVCFLLLSWGSLVSFQSSIKTRRIGLIFDSELSTGVTVSDGCWFSPCHGQKNCPGAPGPLEEWRWMISQCEDDWLTGAEENTPIIIRWEDKDEFYLQSTKEDRDDVHRVKVLFIFSYHDVAEPTVFSDLTSGSSIFLVNHQIQNYNASGCSPRLRL